MTVARGFAAAAGGLRRLAEPFRYVRLVAPLPPVGMAAAPRRLPSPPGAEPVRRRAAAARRSRPALGHAALGFILPALLVAAWELASRLALAPPNLLPTPAAVVTALYELARRGELADHIEITLARVFLGFVLGTAAATVVGALTGYSPLWRRLLAPTLQALHNVPSIAWVPLFILWLGIFEASKVALIAVGVFFPVYLNLMTGIEQVDRKLVEVGRSYGLSGFDLVRRVLLPATLPFYVTGLRAGLGLGWMFVLAAEFMGSSEGVGYLLIISEQTGRTQVIIGAIVLFALLGKLCDLALLGATHRLTAWQDSFKAAGDRQARADGQRRIEAV